LSKLYCLEKGTLDASAVLFHEHDGYMPRDESNLPVDPSCQSALRSVAADPRSKLTMYITFIMKPMGDRESRHSFVRAAHRDGDTPAGKDIL